MSTAGNADGACSTKDNAHSSGMGSTVLVSVFFADGTLPILSLMHDVASFNNSNQFICISLIPNITETLGGVEVLLEHLPVLPPSRPIRHEGKVGMPAHPLSCVKHGESRK
ncbi:hypothetical protein SCP_0701850 [Sparassis crispa]|uniref:Uncharacterized protein n=1 Tax=Sparassis crispa TaxID=139825 RepID=A0A401GS60_9APHY|nr:hypothetical protein SCP_0701850 [Sparassis crispa]GBE85000.1 hypothetical protein SCP_0701850 [Sparassis crispa]